MDFELTDEEKKAIRALKRVAKIWPETLWLFSGGGTLSLMKCGEYGEHIHLEGPHQGGIDPDYEITTINIDNDGGDW